MPCIDTSKMSILSGFSFAVACSLRRSPSLVSSSLSCIVWGLSWTEGRTVLLLVVPPPRRDVWSRRGGYPWKNVCTSDNLTMTMTDASRMNAKKIRRLKRRHVTSVWQLSTLRISPHHSVNHASFISISKYVGTRCHYFVYLKQFFIVIIAHNLVVF